jgi:hypothetical protein
MAARTGGSTYIGYDLGATFGTAVAAGTGDQLQVESLDQSDNPTELTLNPIGAGLNMQNQSDVGASNPSVTVNAPLGYNDAFNFITGQFQGLEVVTASASANIHSFFFNATRNTNWGTLGFHLNSNTAAEFLNCVPTNLGITVAPNDYVKASATLLSTQRRTTGTTNTANSLLSTTQANSQRIIARPSDRFMVNAQAGAALAAGDKVDVTNLEINFTYEQELVGEIRNSSGFGAPRASGTPPLTVEITATLKELDLPTWYTAYEAGTEYKAELLITGPVLGSTTYKYRILFPRLKIVSDPQYNLNTPAINEHVVVFRALVATAAPTGMPDIYPFIEITNERSTRYLVI